MLARRRALIGLLAVVVVVAVVLGPSRVAADYASAEVASRYQLSRRNLADLMARARDHLSVDKSAGDPPSQASADSDVPVREVSAAEVAAHDAKRGAALIKANRVSAEPPTEGMPAGKLPDAYVESSATEDQGKADGKSGSAQRSLVTSSVMIIVSEIGDKTFLIAAIMAMTHPRLEIFGAALSALAVMSVLSAVLGNVLPAVLSRTYTQALAGILFLVFGFRMVREARSMSSDTKAEDELADVAAEIKARGGKDEDAEAEQDEEMQRMESGTFLTQNAKPARRPFWRQPLVAMRRVVACVVSPVFIETFVLTFLAEWGDRSQIATIAMGAAGNVASVIVGTVLGHALCTGIAVVGGRMLAAHISIRTVTMVGAIAFLFFGVLTFVYLE